MKSIPILEKQLAAASGKKCISILNSLAGNLTKISSEKIIDFAKEALKLSLEEGEDKSYQIALCNLCISYIYSGEYETAVKRGGELLGIHEDSGNTAGIIKARELLAKAFEKLSYYDKSFEYMTKTLKMAEELNDLQAISRALQQATLIFNGMKDFKNATL